MDVESLNEPYAIKAENPVEENLEMEKVNDTGTVENQPKEQAKNAENSVEENLEMEKGNDTAKIENLLKEQAKNAENPVQENLDMEKGNDTANVEKHMKEQATDELKIKKEMLEERERSEIEDAREKNGKSEVELEESVELEEGELAEEDEPESTGEFTKVEGALGEVEGELSNVENGEEVERKAVEEDKRVEEEEMSYSEIIEEPETKQQEEILVSAEEIVSNDAEKQELKAFKAHRWLDENFNGSDSSSDDEPSRELKIQFGHNDSGSETEQPPMTAIKQPNQKKQNLKTRGEIDLEDLPPIEKLEITVGDDVELVEVGAVLHNVGVLVVVESKPNFPPLDAETVLFLEGKKVLGKVFDTIGRVIRPCYTVRFNSVAEIEEQGIKDRMPVFYAPQSKEWTHYVFMAHVMKFRGSDASWEHDNEPPPQFIDYSDDESEKRAKAKLRGKPEESSPSPANESRGKRRKNKANQQSRGFGNSMNANRGQTNTAQSGEDRTAQSSSTKWSTNQPLTSWPPKQQTSRPREPVMRHRWARPPAQRGSAVQFSGMQPPMMPFPDLNQPPPLSVPAHQPSPFGPPPSHMHGVPPGPVYQVRPQSFSQGQPSSPWRPFQNAPPYSFTSPPPAPQPAPFYPSQLPPAQNGPLHPAFGSTPQPLASFPQPSFGPQAFFRYRGPSRH